MLSSAKYLFALSAALSFTIFNATLGKPAELIQSLENGEQQTVVVYGTSLTAGGAWVQQISLFLNAQYPGQITWVNSGLSGKASNSGVQNLQSSVLSNNPDAVFIEFATNDSFIAYEEGNLDKDISVAQARTNLESMISSITTQNTAAEVFLQTMNPAWDAPNGNMSGSKRPMLADYFQMYRDVAEEQTLPLVDNNKVWLAVQANDPAEFEARVSDGVHPNSLGYSRYVASAVLHKIGAHIGPSLIIDMQSGKALLHNQSDEDSELVGYSILSSSGALLDDWAGISAQEPDVWVQANPTANHLSELTKGVPLTLAAGQVLDLGIAWDTSESLNLEFQYQTDNGDLHNGHLIFLEDTNHFTTVAGDYNGDGSVDAADYTVWRDSLGSNDSSFAIGSRDGTNSGVVNEADYDYWLSNYGNSSAGVNSIQAMVIPEPCSLMLVVWGIMHSGMILVR